MREGEPPTALLQRKDMKKRFRKPFNWLELKDPANRAQNSVMAAGFSARREMFFFAR